MKKVITAFTLCFMIAGINSEVEALRSIGRGISRGVKSVGRKVGDLAKGRKTNDGTKNIDAAVNSIKGIGNDFRSSGGKQFSYILKSYLNTDSDLDFLAAYSSFADQAGKFLSWLETILTEVRTAYATSLGAQNSANNTENEQKIIKQQQKDELNRENIRRSIEVLIGNIFSVYKAQIQSLAIVLLTVMQNSEDVPKANLREIQRQINDLNKNFRWNDKEFSNYLGQGLSSAIEELEIQVESPIENRIDLLVRQITLIKDILVKLDGFIQNGNKSGIEDILKQMDYYSGDRDTIDEEYAEGRWKSFARQNTRRAAGVPDRYAERYNDEETEDGDWYYSEY